ncbi:MAG: hypothetical protein NT098_05445 [Candidatus Parcubacteria bacterium]|nr:hypothetical protein [Candidatus Parcubacteria bacterium]
MNNNLSKQEKFLKHQHSLHKSMYCFLYSFGTFCVLTAWAAFTYHNRPSLSVQILTSILSVFSAVSGFLLMVYALEVGWGKLFWKQELSKQADKPFKKFALYFALGYALIGVCFIATVFGFRLNAKRCDDMKCFLAVANNCDDVIFKAKDTYGFEWSYYSSRCELEKKLIAVDDNESRQMKASLEGTSVTCAYDKNKFNERWVNSVMGGLDTC